MSLQIIDVFESYYEGRKAPFSAPDAPKQRDEAKAKPAPRESAQLPRAA